MALDVLAYNMKRVMAIMGSGIVFGDDRSLGYNVRCQTLCDLDGIAFPVLFEDERKRFVKGAADAPPLGGGLIECVCQSLHTRI